MSKHEKFISILLSGNSDNNIDFNELIRFLENLQFEVRIRGSHHIFSKNGISEIINIQPKGKMAKDYQVKQIRNLIIKYKLV